MFYSKYFTEEVRSQLTREFMILRQGDRSVAEFVTRFERGCHFVPMIAENAREKLRHFLEGLRSILRCDTRGDRWSASRAWFSRRSVLFCGSFALSNSMTSFSAK